MDAQALLTNSGNTTVLSSTLFKPYQIAMTQELQKTSLKFDLSTNWIDYHEALGQLEENNSDCAANDDVLCKKVDAYLLAALEKSKKAAKDKDPGAQIAKSDAQPPALKSLQNHALPADSITESKQMLTETENLFES